MGADGVEIGTGFMATQARMHARTHPHTHAPTHPRTHARTHARTHVWMVHRSAR